MFEPMIYCFSGETLAEMNLQCMTYLDSSFTKRMSIYNKKSTALVNPLLMCSVQSKSIADYQEWNGSIIMITSPCNEHRCTTQFYIVKLGFTGVYILFLIFALNIDCGYSLELPHLGGSNVYPQSMF